MSEENKVHWGDLKEGDRVRCVREVVGVVEKAPRLDSSIKGGSFWWFAVREDDGTLSEVYSDMHWTTEKLPDPEPVWVNGDVVNNGLTTLARVRDGWINVRTGIDAAPQAVSHYWQRGEVEILYKADQPDGSSAVGKADAQKVA